MVEPKRGIGPYAANIALRVLIGVPMVLPYRLRVPPLVGWLAAHVLAPPLAGYRRRIRSNLAYACPELTEAEIRRLCIAVPPDNAGRVLAELYSAEDRIARHAALPLTGPGVAALEQAKAQAGRSSRSQAISAATMRCASPSTNAVTMSAGSIVRCATPISTPIMCAG